MNPPTLEIKPFALNNQFPRTENVNPSNMNTTLKPRIKANPWVNVFHRFLSGESSDLSLIVLPPRYPTYAGIKGNIHGDKKLKIPARKANPIVTSIELVFHPSTTVIRVEEFIPRMTRSPGSYSTLGNVHRHIHFASSGRQFTQP